MKWLVSKLGSCAIGILVIQLRILICCPDFEVGKNQLVKPFPIQLPL